MPFKFGLFRLGTQHAKSYDDARVVEFSNKILLLYGVVATLFGIAFTWFGQYFSALVVIAYDLMTAYLLWLNSRGQNLQANMIKVVAMSLSVGFISVNLGPAVDGHFLLVVVVPFSIIYFKEQKLWVRRLFIAIPFLTFLMTAFVGYRYVPVATNPIFFNQFISNSVFCMSFLTLSVTVMFYINTFLHLKTNLNHIFSIYDLSERELNIITVLAKGKTNKEIGDALFIEEVTVKNHLKQIFKKTNVKNRTELLAKCIPTYQTTATLSSK